MTSRLEPLGDRVIILPEDEPYRGMLEIPDSAKQRPQKGRVVAVGPGRRELGEMVPLTLQVGDEVVFAKYSGSDYTINGREYLIVKESEVLAIIRQEEET